MRQGPDPRLHHREASPTKNLDTGGLSAPVSFDNPQQLAGTEVAVYQLNAKELKFRELVGFGALCAPKWRARGIA
jgi:hypothetical protein